MSDETHVTLPRRELEALVTARSRERSIAVLAALVLVGSLVIAILALARLGTVQDVVARVDARGTQSECRAKLSAGYFAAEAHWLDSVTSDRADAPSALQDVLSIAALRQRSDPCRALQDLPEALTTASAP